MIQDIPRKLLVRGEEFTEPQVQMLKDLFPEVDQIQLTAFDIRQSLVLQKALKAGVVASPELQTGGKKFRLSLTQEGRALLRKV